MADMIGPILLIALIFVIYHIAGKMDTAGEVKRSKLELSRIDAETRKEEVQMESKRLDIEMGRLAIEAEKLGLTGPRSTKLGLDGPKSTDAEYRFLKEDKEKNRST